MSHHRKQLRGYQEELITPGLRGYNYIICAPTGSGKTLAAAALCYRRMREAEGREGKHFKALFIVPTRHLKGQQRDAFWDVFDPSAVAAVTKTLQFRRNFDQPSIKVLMITAQILVNALRNGSFDFHEVSMLVFDECHHTTLGHSYNEIMKEYMWEKRRLIEAEEEKRGAWLIGRPFRDLPQIVGLTASLGTGGASNAVCHIVKLCANLDCSGVRTVSEPSNVKELERFNNLPEKDEILSTPVRAPCQVSTRMVQILTGIMHAIEKRHNLVSHSQTQPGNPNGLYGSPEYLTYIGPLASKARAKGNKDGCAVMTYLLKLNLSLMAYEDLPAKYVLHAFETFITQNVEDFDATAGGKWCRETYQGVIPKLMGLVQEEQPLTIPKLKRLVDLLEKTFREKPNSRGILLARTRFATLALLDFIVNSVVRTNPASRIRPTRIVGQGKEVEDAQSTSKQEEALQLFRTGQANLLIATDIVQEGLDVPACNFIIRYNFVSNEIGTVQSKGRARARNSECFLIVERGSMNENREKTNRKRVVEMDEAIREINRMKKEEWLGLVGEKQLELLAKMEKKKMANQEAETPGQEARLVCRMCKAFTSQTSPGNDGFGRGRQRRTEGISASKSDFSSRVCFLCGREIA